METALVALAFTSLTLAVTLAVLGSSVPWLWWRTLKLEQKVEALDEVVAELLEAAGVKASTPAPLPPPRVQK